MFRCFICRFDYVLDDAFLHFEKGTCICLRCYLRETGDSRPMPKDLRRTLTSVCEEN